VLILFSCLLYIKNTDGQFVISVFGQDLMSKKKPPEGDLPGALFAFLHHWKILNVFQHTSPERLVRVMMVMMVKLNASHKKIILDECLFIS